jgi:hypothetical protein
MECHIELLKITPIQSGRLIGLADVLLKLGGELNLSIHGVRIEVANNGEAVSVRRPVDRSNKAVVSLDSDEIKDAIAEVCLAGAIEAKICIERAGKLPERLGEAGGVIL